MNQSVARKYISIISGAGLLTILFLSLSIHKVYTLQQNKNTQLSTASQSLQNIKLDNDFWQNKTNHQARNIQNVQNEFVTPSNLAAKAFVVYDASSKKNIARKNSTQPLPLASITKVFTALLVAEHLNLHDGIEISDVDLQTEGNSGLIAGAQWQISDLLKYMLFVSSNDAASAFARALQNKTGKTYKELFEELAKKLNLQTAFAINPSGLDESENFAGAYASAEDVAKAFAYATDTYPEIFGITAKSEYIFKDLSGNEYEVKNTNQSIESIFGAAASKTGFTDLAGGNLVIAFDLSPDERVIIVVLGSSKDGRFSDTLKLYNALVDYYALK